MIIPLGFLIQADGLDTLPVQGVKAITYITTCQDKQAVLSLLCSLLNTVCATPAGLPDLSNLTGYEIQPCILEGPL